MASIDGLVTGMSTTETINQLMKLEAAPQTALKNKITTANKVVTAYQSVSSRLSSLVSAAKAIGDPAGWTAMKATSTSDAAVVSAKAGASAGSMSFKVDRLAATQVMTVQGGISATAVTDRVLDPDGDGLFKLALADGNGDVTKTLDLADGSLKSVAAAINADTTLPYTAAAVRIDAGGYTLQLSAKASGAKGGTDMINAGVPTGLTTGTAVATTIGADAQLKVGTDNPYFVTSATNTFADVLPGVTVTAAKVQTAGDAPVTVSVAADAEGIAAKVQALVDNANVVLAEIASQTKAKSGDVAAGPLAGDAAMRKLSQDILGTVAGGAPGLGLNGTTASFKDVHIGIGDGGKLTFDKDKFLEKFRADPTKAAEYFTAHTDAVKPDKDGVPRGTAGVFEPGFDVANGLARRLQTVGMVATEGVVDPRNPTASRMGTLQELMKRRNENIRSLNDQVAQWDVRLESRRSALQLQFSNLEVALGKMQQQSSWLAGQLAGLA